MMARETGWLVLGADLAADQKVAQRGRERDREQRRDQHHERLGVRERLEQPARLAGQREHRQERDRDDQQREEDRRRDLLAPPRRAAGGGRRPGGACSSFLCDASIITISASTVAPIAIAMPPRLMIVDGMSSRYIGMNGERDAIGRLQDRQQRAAEVEQEQDDHQADDDRLLDQRVLRACRSTRSISAERS